MASYLAWFHDIINIDRSYINAVFNNKRLARQYGGRLVIEKVQTQLRNDKQRSKDKQGSKNKQKGKEIGVEEVNKSKDKQKHEETGVKEVNKLDKPSKSSDELDEPSESSELNRSFILIV